MATQAELVGDLKALRKGRGLFRADVADRVGHTLRELCGVTERDDPGEVRYRIGRRVARLAADLPDDLRVAVLAAFGMLPAARHPLYQDRVGWLADHIDREPRTARRRIDEGIHQLAQLACTPLRAGVHPRSGWHTAETRVIAMLDRAVPEVLEHHRVVAAQEVTELDLPVPPGRDVAVAYGGTLRAGKLTLATPLRAGEAHEFALRTRLPVRPRQLVHVPGRRCDFLELRVRFDRGRQPRQVSRLPGDAAPVPVDGAGEVRLTFADLSRGFTYGARWD
ncbi:hypothetical protein [Actinophytocola glycyrrhizae]|uniref:XRE family transcriptional regulator n=1 Tax=Actinophytocola glycyrrhizae TaxID=2044873 RepID=A0ABV9S4M2_9PSEU